MNFFDVRCKTTKNNFSARFPHSLIHQLSVHVVTHQTPFTLAVFGRGLVSDSGTCIINASMDCVSTNYVPG